MIKNPGTLSELGSNVRGVITASGDLFMETDSAGTIHNDILKTLIHQGVIPGPLQKNWTRKTPDQAGFVTVQRFKDDAVVCIGESNRLLYTKDGYEQYIDYFRPFLEAAKSKNPGISFVDKLVRIRAPFTGDWAVVYRKSREI